MVLACEFRKNLKAVGLPEKDLPGSWKEPSGLSERTFWALLRAFWWLEDSSK